METLKHEKPSRIENETKNPENNPVARMRARYYRLKEAHKISKQLIQIFEEHNEINKTEEGARNTDEHLHK